MPPLGHLSVKRLLFVIIGSPLLGGFLWGAFNPPKGWENFAGRIINGILAAPMSVFVMFARPDKLQSWAYIAITFLVLLLVAVRWPRSTSSAGS